MVSSFVVITDTTVGLRRAAPHQAAALDPPGSRLISWTAAGFRHDALLQQVICDWPEDRLLARPQNPRHPPASPPPAGKCDHRDAPSMARRRAAHRALASSTPRPHAPARRLGGRACGSFQPRSCRESVALWSARRDGRPCGKRATPPADGGRQIQASMLTGGLVAAHRGSQQPVAEQSGHRPVQLGSGAPAMPVSPRRDYAGKADFCSSSEGSVEATRRHAWGCWA